MSEFCDFQKLADLLNPPKNDSDDDKDEEERRRIEEEAANRQGGEIVNPYEKIKEEPQDQKEFLDEDEFIEKGKQDWKKTPKFDVTYRQKVTPEDMFLGMSAKTPGTASCEDMIITIRLPDEKHQNIDLKIQEKSLELISPKFYANIPLPHPVDPQKGNAGWHKEREELVVTLRMHREFDFINF